MMRSINALVVPIIGAIMYVSSLLLNNSSRPSYPNRRPVFQQLLFPLKSIQHQLICLAASFPIVLQARQEFPGRRASYLLAMDLPIHRQRRILDNLSLTSDLVDFRYQQHHKWRPCKGVLLTRHTLPKSK